MREWLMKIWQKFTWLFVSKKVKQEKAQAEALELYEKIQRADEAEKQLKRVKEFEAYMKSWIDEGKKRGMNESQAIKWAKKKIEEQSEKNRRSGRLIACETCGQRGVNHKTGGMIRNPDGSYRHQNCGGK